MEEKDREQQNQSDSEQYADAAVLGRLINAQNILFDLPDEIRIAEYFTRVLKGVPGVVSCFVCLGKNSTCGDDVNELCKNCRKSQKNEAGIQFFPDDFKCGYAEKLNLRTLLIGRSERNFGFIVFSTGSDLAFEPYSSYLHNLADLIAFSLENRIRKELLEESRLQLKMVNKELEEFAYSVSHDLRAPLRGIDGFSQALLDDYKERFDQKGINYLNRLRTASQNMSQLINEMLKLSRISRSEMMIQTVNLSKMFTEIVNDLKETQPERKVRFLIKENLKVQGDSRLLRIVLENLISNAWKFTSKHSETFIEFGIKQINGSPVYFISDDGAGFDMNYSQNLFSVFRRLHNTTEFPGTGTGLAIVQRVIHRHGGKIWAEGDVEKGAVFYFTLK